MRKKENRRTINKNSVQFFWYFFLFNNISIFIAPNDTVIGEGIDEIVGGLEIFYM